MWIASWCKSEAGAAIRVWGIEKEFDNTPSQELLGVKYRPLEDTLKDMVVALIETEYIPDQRK
jgi:hypothetical protein